MFLLLQQKLLVGLQQAPPLSDPVDKSPKSALNPFPAVSIYSTVSENEGAPVPINIARVLFPAAP